MRVAVGAVIQESNTFSPVPGTLDHFRGLYHVAGAEVPLRLRDSSTEVSGFYDVLGPAGHEAVPIVAAMSVSAGRLERKSYDVLRDQLLDGLAAKRRPDAVLLALHGAMALEDEDDGDGALLAEVRGAVGPEVPIVVTHDLHANLTRRRAALCDAIVGYRTAPHVDHRETGARAARLLLRILETGRRPRNRLRKIPMIAPSVKMNTAIAPLGPIVRRAQEFERNPATPSVSCFWMQPWLDVAEAGAAVDVVCFGSDADAAPALDALAGEIWRTRGELEVRLWSARDAIRDAMRQPGGPCVFADTGDAPPGGAPGDGNFLLGQFVDERVEGPVLVTLLDPAAARRMHEAGTGSELELTLGGAVDRARVTPRPFRGRVGRLSDGRFRWAGPIARGQEADMGPVGVFEIGGVRVLVHSRPVFSHDPSVFRAVGLEPREAKIVVAKSPTQFRACYEPIARKIYEVETPGVTTVNLRSLEWRRIPRPMWPLEDDE